MYFALVLIDSEVTTLKWLAYSFIINSDCTIQYCGYWPRVTVQLKLQLSTIKFSSSGTHFCTHFHMY